MNNINNYVDSLLYFISDEAYREFQKTLLPGIKKEQVIGVRIPILRRFTRDFIKTPDASCFMTALPHSSYDANNLHAFIIEQVKDFNQCIIALDKFLPFVDNWATCDMMSPKILKTEPTLLLTHIERWLRSCHTYEVRFAIVCLMRYYLDSDFNSAILYKVVNISSDEYYINMARAWFFATALAKQWDATIGIIEDNALDLFTHNRTIQKAIESYRVSNDHKMLLRTLRR